MAVKIRMKRTGATNAACFRVVAADMRSPRDGKNLETLGWYSPGAKGRTFEIKLDRVDYWLGVGAQISDTVSSLVKRARKQTVPGVEALPSIEDTLPLVDPAPESVEPVSADETAMADAN